MSLALVVRLLEHTWILGGRVTVHGGGSSGDGLPAEDSPTLLW